MKRTTMAGLLALCLAAPLGALAQGDDAAKAKDLGQQFNVPSSQLTDIREKVGMDWEDIRTSLMISQHSGASLSEVVRLKKSGLSFDDIASRYNLRLSDIERSHMEKGAKEGFREAPAPAPRRASRKAARIADEFGVSSDEVMRLHDRGLGWSEVRHALFISGKAGKPLSEVVALKESGMDFDDIAARYNVDLKDEKSYVKERMREAPAPQKRGETEPSAPQQPAPEQQPQPGPTY